jgi:methylglutaconyl-CoA hydratase
VSKELIGYIRLIFILRYHTMNFVKYHTQERVAYITLNRPEKRNALNYEVVKELKEAFAQAEKDSEAKVIVLCAEGNSFCAGADLEYLQSLQKFNHEENLKDSHHLMELYKNIYTHKKVVIAQVNGHAIAGGCGLVSVCDYAFSAPDANYGYTETRIGFIPAIVMTFLIRKIGEAKAKELLLAGEIIHAFDAKSYGLVNWVVEDKDKLADTVFDFAKGLCNNNSAQSMALTKKMISEIQTMPLDQALHYAAGKNAEARATEDCKRGIASFLNKEKLQW